jgi:hypothetical protein
MAVLDLDTSGTGSGRRDVSLQSLKFRGVRQFRGVNSKLEAAMRSWLVLTVAAHPLPPPIVVFRRLRRVNKLGEKLEEVWL